MVANTSVSNSPRRARDRAAQAITWGFVETPGGRTGPYPAAECLREFVRRTPLDTLFPLAAHFGDDRIGLLEQGQLASVDVSSLPFHATESLATTLKRCIRTDDVRGLEFLYTKGGSLMDPLWVDAGITHPNASIRIAAAIHCDLSDEHVRRLLRDPNSEVRHALSRNSFGAATTGGYDSNNHATELAGGDQHPRDDVSPTSMAP